MTDYIRALIETLKQLAEEIDNIGAHLEPALPEMVRQFNVIHAQLREKYPTHKVWEIVRPLAPGAKAAELALACAMLEQAAKTFRTTESQRRNAWHVFNPGKPTEIGGHYQGDVIVESGCSCKINGCLQGNVYLKGTARLENAGKFAGNVYADAEAEFLNNGSFQGSVKRRGEE